MSAADAVALRSAGVSRQAATDALYVAYVFNINDRLADTLGYALPPDDYMQAPGALLSKRGYSL